MKKNLWALDTWLKLMPQVKSVFDLWAFLIDCIELFEKVIGKKVDSMWGMEK